MFYPDRGEFDRSFNLFAIRSDGVKKNRSCVTHNGIKCGFENFRANRYQYRHSSEITIDPEGGNAAKFSQRP